MPVVLRAWGEVFDVERFLATCRLPGIPTAVVYYKGQGTYKGKKKKDSGFNIPISEAGFKDFSRQIQDAVEFLKNHSKGVRKLCLFPGVEEVYLDFALSREKVIAQFDHLPKELIQIAGSLGLGIELSHYPLLV